MDLDSGNIYYTDEEINAARAAGRRVAEIPDELAVAIKKLEAEAGKTLKEIVEEQGRAGKVVGRWVISLYFEVDAADSDAAAEAGEHLAATVENLHDAEYGGTSVHGPTQPNGVRWLNEAGQ